MWRSPTSKRLWASRSAEMVLAGERLVDEHRRTQEDLLLLGVDGV